MRFFSSPTIVGVTISLLMPLRITALIDRTTPTELPVEQLKAVRDTYQGLQSFSMRIEHQDSSGLYPGRYTQTQRWRKGGRFELLVSDQKLNPELPETLGNPPAR